uniref:Uncharacterized protein n=1 Tax=Romanomermis culicivorax TaxID=13658 RepID=A0A915KI37_ROMCU
MGSGCFQREDADLHHLSQPTNHVKVDLSDKLRPSVKNPKKTPRELKEKEDYILMS